MSQAGNASVKSGDHMLVLEKGLAVIECFDGRSALSVSDVAGFAGLSRAAARRCLLTLTSLGYASTDGRLFRLEPRVLRLGFSYLSHADLPRIIQPFLERIAAALSQSSSASVLDGPDVLYVARAATKRIISIDLRVGSRLPAYCNAMGRVLLAALPPDQAKALLKGTPPVRRTPTTLHRVPDLLAALQAVAADGYSVVDGELEPGLVAVAVPVRNMAGAVVAAVNVVSHVDRTSAAQLLLTALPHLRGLQEELRPLLRTSSAP